MKMKTKLHIPSFHKHVEQLEILYILGGNAKCTVTLEKVGQFLVKLNIHPPHNSEISLLGMYPKEMKMHVHTKPVCECLKTVLYVIAKNWKISNYFNWQRRNCHISIMENLSAIKRSGLK